MDPDRHRRVSEIFLRACELPPTERAGFLDTACDGDSSLRQEVESLFAQDERAALVVSPEMILPQVAQLLEEAGNDGAPKQIGPYRILRKLGEGGMAVVYLAEQERPIRRLVALKLIRWGMDTREVVARFESERQALALMNHPGIAKVFEAGATPEGLPYFVMEHVEGIPITTYCDHHRLPIPARLRLFQQVCEGVQHAHHRAVIHRDLKPSNILVSGGGGRASSKIIDFGVAKATAHRLTDTTLHTQMGTLIGTLDYMSPEQAGMNPQDVDTRTDVYSLGVILYQLLTGALPFASKEPRDSDFDEIRRRIREVEPSRPSTRIASLGSAAAPAARQLRGDLDWITMKALEKEPSRRYGSPSELAADLTRHLEHQPVLASPPSAVYRARKYVRRHRFGVLASAGLLLVLLAFAATMTLQSRRIASERDRANREAELARSAATFLQRMFETPNPSRASTVTAREILDAAAKEVEAAQGSEPAFRAQQMAILGGAYASLGLYSQAEGLLRRSHETRRRLLGDEHPDTLASMHRLAGLLASQGRLDEADAALSDVYGKRKRVLGAEHPDTLASLEARAVLRQAQGRPGESAEILEQVLEKRRLTLGAEHPDALRTMGNLAMAYEGSDRFPEAEALDLQALEVMRRVLGPEHPDTLRLLNNLGVVYESEAKHAEAVQLYESAIPSMRRVLGAEHPDTLKAMVNLAGAYGALGRYTDAEALDREALGLHDRVLGPEHPDTLWVMRSLAVVYGKEGRHLEASQLMRQAFEIAQRAFGPDDPETVDTLYDMAVLALQRGRRDEALDHLRDAVRHGYARADQLAEDPDLETLHGDRRFDAIVETARERSAGS